VRAERKYARVERDEDVKVHEDENAHLWAVSYSDFLMALLSFFILFFSLNGSDRQDMIMKLSKDFSGAGAGTANGPTAKVDKEPARLPSSIFASIAPLHLQMEKEKDFIVVSFPDDIYRAGQYKMGKDKEELMTLFLNVVKNYQNEVSLYFEGHTDSQPLTKHKNSIVVDNFVLSSLRASTALQFAKDAGFDDKFLFIQASSSNIRNSRSLSIRIEPRKVTL
jgi:flagellar motor protein MotB